MNYVYSALNLPKPSLNSPTSDELSVPDLNLDHKRKRSQEAEIPLVQALSESSQKRPRISLPNFTIEDRPKQEKVNELSENGVNPISHWVQKGRWPESYLKQANQSRGNFEQGNSCKGHIIRSGSMNHLLARKRSSPSLNRTESIIGTVNDQNPREEKTAPYSHPGYETLLATKGSYMDKSELGITNESKNRCQTLFSTYQEVPQNSLFRDDRFDEACRSVHTKNEARVIRDITPLICPSAEIIAIYEATKPKLLIDSVNEGWNNSIPITKTRPQPDYSVGFRRAAFTDDQLKKLEPFVGDLCDTSFFRATYYMYFPFLTCEVKCGGAALDVADRQNAHSMTLAVRGIVELFRYVKREKELHREILSFSISHDHSSVRMNGHYAVIMDDKTAYYRHPIKEFSFTSEEGKDKWTAYKFTKNIYDIWMPIHHKRICSAIDLIPLDIDFGVSISGSLTESEPVEPQEMAVSVPSSQDAETFKKPKLPRKTMLQQENERLKYKLDVEREQSKQENTRLNERLDQLMDSLREQKEENKGLMDILKQRLT